MSTFTIHGTTHASLGEVVIENRRSRFPEGMSFYEAECEEVLVARLDEPPKAVTCMSCLAAER